MRDNSLVNACAFQESHFLALNQSVCLIGAMVINTPPEWKNIGNQKTVSLKLGFTTYNKPTVATDIGFRSTNRWVKDNDLVVMYNDHAQATTLLLQAERFVGKAISSPAQHNYPVHGWYPTGYWVYLGDWSQRSWKCTYPADFVRAAGTMDGEVVRLRLRWTVYAWWGECSPECITMSVWVWGPGCCTSVLRTC